MNATLQKNLHFLAVIAVSALAILYVSATTIRSSSGLQITGMMEWSPDSAHTRLFEWLYTSLLATTAIIGTIQYFRNAPTLQLLTVLLSGGSILMTIYPVLYSLLHNRHFSFYEYYAGEAFTCLALLALAVTSTHMPSGRDVGNKTSAS